MRYVVAILLTVATLVVVTLSFLAVFETYAWWVRMTDFPRAQYLIVLAVLALVLLVARPLDTRLRVVLGVLVLSAACFNVLKLWPYFPGGPSTEQSCADDKRFSVIVANVQLGNRRAERLVELVRERDPDLLLAMETDAWWNRQLAVLEEEMPHALAYTTGSYFGIHLYSRLPLRDAEVVFPIDHDHPAVLASVVLPSGELARFIGLHPRPPHAGRSAPDRDAELLWAALQARKAEVPALVAGDLNAVPWETVIERMQRVGALIDPREVHGFLSTFGAHTWWVFWPLDQVLYQQGLSVLSMEVLPFIDSDHYPVEAVFCLRPTSLQAPEMLANDLEEAEQTFRRARRTPD